MPANEKGLYGTAKVLREQGYNVVVGHLRLGGAESFTYLNQGNCEEIPGVDDAQDFRDLMVFLVCVVTMLIFAAECLSSPRNN